MAGSDNLVVGPLQERDLPDAATIVRQAFGTFVGAPDLTTFWTDRDLVQSRWRAGHVAAFGATLDGALVGSNFATRWGSVGYFGPLTIRPDLWDRGIGRRLMEPVMAQFEVVADGASRPVHLRPQQQARRAVRAVRLCRALSHGGHGEACRPVGCQALELAALRRPGRRAAGGGAAGMPRPHECAVRGVSTSAKRSTWCASCSSATRRSSWTMPA